MNMTFEDVNYLHDSPRLYSDIVSKDILNKLSLNSEAQSQTTSQCSTWNIFRSSSTVRNCFISSLQTSFSWPTNFEPYPASGSSPNVLKQVWDQSPERFVRNKKNGFVDNTRPRSTQIRTTQIWKGIQYLYHFDICCSIMASFCWSLTI